MPINEAYSNPLCEILEQATGITDGFPGFLLETQLRFSKSMSGRDLSKWFRMTGLRNEPLDQS